MNTERRASWNRRQIDDIDKKVSEILKIMNGNGKVGIVAKVNIMWDYRSIFIGLFAVNLLSLISFIVYVVKGG